MSVMAWRDTYLDLQETLVRAQADRRKRDEWDGNEFGWMTHERQVMTDRTNLLRQRLGRLPVTIERVAVKERRAAGHVDYTSKWAIGCADLVHDALPAPITTQAAPGRRDRERDR